MGCGASTSPLQVAETVVKQATRHSEEAQEAPLLSSSLDIHEQHNLASRSFAELKKRLSSRKISKGDIHHENPSVTLLSEGEQFDIFEEPVPYEEIRQKIEAKFQHRSTKDDLIARNILKGNISGNLLQAQLSLKFNMASDKLAQTLAKRPHRGYLVEKNILKDMVGDRSFQGAQVISLRQKAQDRLRKSLDRNSNVAQIQV